MKSKSADKAKVFELQIRTLHGPKRPSSRKRVVRVRAPSDFAARLALASYFEDPDRGVKGYVIDLVRVVRAGADLDAVLECPDCDAYGSMPHAPRCKGKRVYVAHERCTGPMCR